MRFLKMTLHHFAHAIIDKNGSEMYNANYELTRNNLIRNYTPISLICFSNKNQYYLKHLDYPRLSVLKWDHYTVHQDNLLTDLMVKILFQ